MNYFSAILATSISMAYSTVLCAAAPAPIDFSWRKHEADFPKDKPAYLILTTEDALQWSKVLPEFVQHKEGVGFRVYVVTEKDYGSGKTGNEQAFHLRAWLRKFQQRTNARYALFIGDGSPSSANLPSPTRPDGEHTGMDEAFRDLDGRCNDSGGDWIDAYLRSLPEQPNRALPAKNELLMGRISYLGNEIGNSVYDLDRILAKFMRYENETLAGKNLDWRGRAISVVSNYGGSAWDLGFKDSMEKAGGLFEHHSTSWNMADGNSPIPDMIPENFQGTWSSFSLSDQLVFQTRPHGLMANMSHGCNRGSEGILDQGEIFRDMDDRHPSVVGITACTALHLADNCNMGQAHLRRDAIFSFGTSHSGNNGYRTPLLEKLIESRGSIGEAFDMLDSYCAGIVWYGDPSLRVLRPKGEPLAVLQVNPTLGYHYEERTVDMSRPIKPVVKTYTVTNQSKQPMTVVVSTGVNWLTASVPKLELQPGKSAKVEVRTNGAADQLPNGAWHAAIRFCNTQNGLEEERRLSLSLQPLALASYHSFDADGKPPVGQPVKPPAQFQDWVKGDFPGSVAANSGTIALPPVPPATAGTQAPEPPMSWEEKGRVGGALRFNGKGQPLTVSTPDYLSWRGYSASFWVKLDALPAEKGMTVLLQAPVTLAVNDRGVLSMVRDGEPVTVGTVTAGAWQFIQIRSDLARAQVRASLNGKAEVACAFSSSHSLANYTTFAPFAGSLDELKIWSGEWSDWDRANEIRSAAGEVSVANPVPALRATASVNTRLEWRPINQPDKSRFQIYLGESAAAVAAATPTNSPNVLVAQTTEPWVAPVLAPGKIYFWRVDVIGEVTKGPVWIFKTQADPFQILRPVAEGSAAGDPRPFTDPHRGLLLRTPTLYSFQVPAGVSPAKAYLYVKGFPYPWFAVHDFTLYKIEGSLAGWTGGGVNPETYKNAVKTRIATGTFAHIGNWLDVSSHLTPGKSVCFALEGPAGANLNFFSLANSECRGFFGSGDINQAMTPKLVLISKDAPPLAMANVLPKAVNFTEDKPMADLGSLLPMNSKSTGVTFSLKGAPEWAQISVDGKVSLRSGVRIEDLDFGGYDSVLCIQLAGGQTFERPLKIRIPVPEIRIKMDRSNDGMISFLPATATPLAKGVIRYTTDGSPVQADSPVFTTPFQLAEGMKPTARFFYLDKYPMAPVGS